MTRSGHFNPWFKEASRTRCIVLEGIASRGSVPSETRRVRPRVWERSVGGFEGFHARVLTPCAPVWCPPEACVKGRAQRLRHREGDQAGRSRQRLRELVVQPQLGCVVLTLGTMPMAAGMMDAVVLSTGVTGREARAVCPCPAAADGVDGLVVGGGEVRMTRNVLRGRGGAEGAYGGHDGNPRMSASRRWEASSWPLCVRWRESMVVARCAWPMERCMARRLTPASSRCVA